MDDPTSLGRLGAYVSWANTRDRSARTAKARAASPISFAFWHNSFADDPEPLRTQRASAAWRANQLRMSLNARDARRRARGAS